MSHSSRSHRIGTTGNLQQSMRANYGKHGVDNYYKQVGTSYRNPHFPGVRACVFAWLERWWARENGDVASRLPVIFDMACGTGEVTVAAYEWWKSGSRLQKRKKGISNPQPARDGHDIPLGRVEEPDQMSSVTSGRDVPNDLLMIAADPYTQAAYVERTTLPCAPLSFREISGGTLPPIVTTVSSIGANCTGDSSPSTDKIDMVICSFALHLVESSSELFALLWELSTKARWLVVLAPHKKPEIKEGWGWVKWDSEGWTECSMNDRREFIQERVHCRVYRSLNAI